MKKKISQIEQRPMDCWEAANVMHGLKSDDAKYNDPTLAGEAAAEMKAAGWRFWIYSDWGDEVHVPPGWTEDPPPYPLPVI